MLTGQLRNNKLQHGDPRRLIYNLHRPRKQICDQRWNSGQGSQHTDQLGDTVHFWLVLEEPLLNFSSSYLYTWRRADTLFQFLCIVFLCSWRTLSCQSLSIPAPAGQLLSVPEHPNPWRTTDFPRTDILKTSVSQKQCIPSPRVDCKFFRELNFWPDNPRRFSTLPQKFPRVDPALTLPIPPNSS